MGFVIDKQGNYLPVFGETTGGGSGTSNHASLSNLDYAHSGHTGFMSNANYIQAGKLFEVKLDGSGDFTKLSDAIAYLDGKWSDGRVIIHLGEGTFTESANIEIGHYVYFNIPRIDIYGEGEAKTKLSFTSNQVSPCFSVWGPGTYVVLGNITIEQSGGSKSTDYRGICAYNFGNLTVYNLTTEGCNYALNAIAGGKVAVNAPITIKNCSLGFGAEGGLVQCMYGMTMNFNNVDYAFFVLGGGIMQLNRPTYNGTSVTYKTNITPGTSATEGLITGITA